MPYLIRNAEDLVEGLRRQYPRLKDVLWMSLLETAMNEVETEHGASLVSMTHDVTGQPKMLIFKAEA